MPRRIEKKASTNGKPQWLRTVAQSKREDAAVVIVRPGRLERQRDPSRRQNAGRSILERGGHGVVALRCPPLPENSLRD